METCLKVLREKSQSMRKVQKANIFKKKKAPEKLHRVASRELNIYREEPKAKSFKEALTLKNFLKNKVKYKTVKTESKLPKKLNKTEFRKSSMMTRKNKELLQESLRKYLPKGFKKMKKKRNAGLNSTKIKADYSTSGVSGEGGTDQFFKSGKIKKQGKHLVKYPRSQKQMKLDSLIHASRRTGLTNHEDSALDLHAKKDKSLPKIAMMMNSHKNISQFYSKRYLEKTKTEYDYLGSDRATDLSKFDLSRLSHGSMISNRLKKKVCIKKRPDEPATSVSKLAKKKAIKLGKGKGKATTAKKKKFEKKKYFRSENPHLRTAPDVIRKHNLRPKEKSVFKSRKDVSIPKHLIKHLRSNKVLTRHKKVATHKTLPKTSKKLKKRVDGKAEGNFGIFDFSAKAQNEIPIIGKEVKSYESMTRLFSQNPKKAQSKSNKRVGYSSSSLKKQRLPSGVIGQKKYTRGSAFYAQKVKINKVRLGNLGNANPFHGKKKVLKGITSKYSSQKSRNLKNLTIDTYSPKNGFFKQKILKNWTEKNNTKKGFFNDSMNNYFRIAGQMDNREAPTRSVGKAKVIGEKPRGSKLRSKLPQQVYNNIRMGDSNVKNNFIINIGNLQRSGNSNPKSETQGKKVFEGLDSFEKEIQQILKFK